MTRTVICSTCSDQVACAESFRLKLKENYFAIAHDSSLKSMPSSIHFHIRPNSEKHGTLEVTFDPKSKSVWLSTHLNRTQPWIEAAEKQILTWGCPSTKIETPIK